MNKYIRSRAKLSALIKEIFGVCDISVDSKAIVLLLAGTLPSSRFAAWIDQIPALNSLNAKFKQINALRCEFGVEYRNYIILKAMQAADHTVCSDELQAFVCASKKYPQNQAAVPLVNIDLEQKIAMNSGEFTDVKLHAYQKLRKKLFSIYTLNSNLILDTYLQCRTLAEPNVAAQALVQALTDVLCAENLTATDAEHESRKLVARATKIFSSHKSLLFTAR